MLRFVEVSMGDGGSVACTRCVPPSDPAYRPAADIIAEAASAVAAGAENISLTGAEPFGHPDLPAVVSGIAHAGVSRLRVVTVGAALAAGENAAGAQAAGLRHARVVLLGPEGVHDALADAPGLFDAAAQGMHAWTEAADAAGHRAFLSVLLPVCEHNIAMAPAAVAEAARHGAREVVMRVSPSIDTDRARDVVAAACETGTINRVWVRVEGPAEVLPPALALHLTPAMPSAEAHA